MYAYIPHDFNFQIYGSIENGIAVSAIVAIHPTFIFATGRVFPEVIVAIFTIVMIFGLLIYEKWQSWNGVLSSSIISGLSMGLILFVKGLIRGIVLLLRLSFYSGILQIKWGMV